MRTVKPVWAAGAGALLVAASCGASQSVGDRFAVHFQRHCSTVDQVDECRAYVARLTEFATGCERSAGADEGCSSIGPRLQAARLRLQQLQAQSPSTTVASGVPSVAPSPPEDAPSAPAPKVPLPDGPPSEEAVRAAAVEATKAALARCGLIGHRALLGAALDVKTTGEVSGVRMVDGSLGAAGALDCLTQTYGALRFPSFTMPAATGKGQLLDCPPGAVFRRDLCKPVVRDSLTFPIAVMIMSDGAVLQPTQAQASHFREQYRADAVHASCAATKASGFQAGIYAGEASQRLRLRDGTQVFGWKSLTLTVDPDGCLSWRGLSFADIVMPGDDARNIEKINATCINDGDGTITANGAVFKLTGVIRGKASGGTPTRFHVWRCPAIGNVKADLSVDLRANGCNMIGNAADPTAEVAAETACQMSHDFDELKDRTLTLSKDGSISLPLTIADPATLVLHKVDRRQ
jgi:hypothetical protein